MWSVTTKSLLRPATHNTNQRMMLIQNKSIMVNSMRTFASSDSDKKPHVIPNKEDLKDTAKEKVKDTIKEKVGLGDKDKNESSSWLTSKYLWGALAAGAGYYYLTSGGNETNSLKD